MNKGQNKNLWKNDYFAGCIMTIIVTCILALVGIGGGQVWSNTKYGYTGLHQEKVMSNAMKAKTSIQLFKDMEEK